MKYSFFMKRCKKFPHVELMMKEAMDLYPHLDMIINKVSLSPFWKKDGSMVSKWKKKRSKFLLNCNISINVRVLRSKRYDISNLGGIIWHELGHAFSYFICLMDNRFQINEKGAIAYCPLKGLVEIDHPMGIRDVLLDEFWEKECAMYGHSRIVSLELKLNPHPLNASELVAESFKYAYAGEEHISKEQFQLVRNIVNDFIAEFLK